MCKFALKMQICKSTATPSPKLKKNVEKFFEISGANTTGYIVYNGSETFPLSEQIWLIPFWEL